MPKANGKKSQTTDFNEYLSLLMTLEGDALKEWNRESMRRSRLLDKEIFEVSRSNIQKYLRTPGAEKSLAEKRTHTGEVTLKWEIDMEPGELRLRVTAGDACADFGLIAGHPILDRITVNRFISLIDQHLIAASLSLFEASAIYGSEKVQKGNPRSWQRRFMDEQKQRLEELTGKPKKSGRPENARKSCLRKEDETNQLKTDVMLAVQNLYEGKSDHPYHCPKHRQRLCSGHDFEEIDVALVAGYLNRSAGTLRNKLSKAKLKYPDLKKETLASVTD